MKPLNIMVINELYYTKTINIISNLSLLIGEMMDLDIEMLNDAKSHEDVPEIGRCDDH